MLGQAFIIINANILMCRTKALSSMKFVKFTSFKNLYVYGSDVGTCELVSWAPKL